MKYFDIDSFREIMDSLSRNKSRTFLTGFGIFWGMFMLVLLLGGGNGLSTYITETLGGISTNSAIIIPGETSKPYKGFKSGRTFSFKSSDLQMLKAGLEDADVITGMVASWNQNVIYEDKKASASCNGVTPEYQYMALPEMKFGRYINQIDIDMARKVCVIGKRVYEGLFTEGEDPCGKLVRYQGIYFEIVGVDFSNSNMSINGTPDRTITIPMNVAQQIFRRGDSVDLICLTAKKDVKVTGLVDKALVVLGREHYFDPSDKKAAVIINVEQMYNIVSNLFKGINILILLIGLGTLLAAAIGVSNIMLVTVKERTVEIGIRRAIGATPKMIVFQIMSESILLTIVSGLFGIVCAVSILSILENKVGPGFIVSFGTSMSALGALILLGVLAGLAPTSRAMAIKPVDAMRDE